MPFAWGSSLRSLVLTSLFSAELYDLCSAFHRSERVLHEQFSYEIDSMAERDFFLTQLIRSQVSYDGKYPINKYIFLFILYYYSFFGPKLLLSTPIGSRCRLITCTPPILDFV